MINFIKVKYGVKVDVMFMCVLMCGWYVCVQMNEMFFGKKLNKNLHSLYLLEYANVTGV